MINMATINLYEQACKEIAKILLSSRSVSREYINQIKKSVAKKYGLKKLPTNADILSHIDRVDDKERLKKILLKKPVRSISGIVIVALMSYPFECPHGRCLYCPHVPGAPVSYTGQEPSARRGIDNNFDPVLQIRKRLKQLESIGHSVDKVYLIIQGGTFNAEPKEYREWFMLGVLEALIGRRPKTFEEGAILAERSRYRLVGLAFETRPDQCSEEQIDWMLSRGATRVELGVQTIYDDVYDVVGRGHHVKEVIEASRRLKDAALKVTYHIMPGLPNTNLKLDYQIFEKIFSSSHFLPDHIKIYPTLVLEHTGLLKLWKLGKYNPLSTEEAIELISRVKHCLIPPYLRIMRVNRDIPSTEIIAGIDKTNLRQYVHRFMSENNLRCRCIRCREVGHVKLRGKEPIKQNIIIKTMKFYANEGIEYFISAEDAENDILIGFLRLRRPSYKAWRPEIINYESYLVRELHVYGKAIPLGLRDEESWQHRGIGESLLKYAEELASSEGGEKIIIMSGIGVREYYFRYGYARDGPYVSKIIK